MKLTKSQVKIANKLLKELCRTETMDSEKAYSFFDSKSDAQYVCSELEKERLLLAFWNNPNIIALLKSNDNTCDCVENKKLDKELSKERKSIFSINLTLISLIVSVILNIGLIVNLFRKSDDPSNLKANLTTCMTQVLKLNHVVDSLTSDNHKLQEQVKILEK